MKLLRSRWRRFHQYRSVKASGAFDEGYYRQHLPKSLRVRNALSHYFEAGEAWGLPPNADFDPQYYARSNQDVSSSDSNLFAHYLRYGIGEKRPSRPVPEQVSGEYVWAKEGPETVLLVVHEVSRTGAPILGWNILQELKKIGRRVAVVALGPGELSARFRADADYFLQESMGADLRHLAENTIRTFNPAYAICNSAVTAPFGQHLSNGGLRTVGLIHEFGATIGGIPGLAECLADWSEVVFPAQIVRKSVVEAFPSFGLRNSRVVPQGRSVVPRAGGAAGSTGPIEELRAGSDFLVMGAGTFEFRKGVDLFVATAAAAVRKAPQTRFRFIWIGGRQSEMSDYRIMLREQISRSGLQDVVAIYDTTEHIDNVYQTADAFLLSSRLDPLPNVSIDAASYGVPLVCFDQASGTAELMQRREALRSLVVHHLDADAAAQQLVRLATDRPWLEQTRSAMLAFASDQFDMQAYVRQVDDLGMLRSSDVKR